MLLRNVLLIMFFVTGSIRGFAFTAPGLPAYPAGTLLKKLISLPAREIEGIVGRKLSLKEKIGLKLLQWKYKKDLKYYEKDTEGKAEKRAKASLSFGLASIGFLILGLLFPPLSLMAIPCSIIAIVTGIQSLGKTKNNTKSIAGIVLGSLFIILLLVLLLAIIHSAGPK